MLQIEYPHDDVICNIAYYLEVLGDLSSQTPSRSRLVESEHCSPAYLKWFFVRSIIASAVLSIGLTSHRSYNSLSGNAGKFDSYNTSSCSSLLSMLTDTNRTEITHSITRRTFGNWPDHCNSPRRWTIPTPIGILIILVITGHNSLTQFLDTQNGIGHFQYLERSCLL